MINQEFKLGQQVFVYNGNDWRIYTILSVELLNQGDTIKYGVGTIGVVGLIYYFDYDNCIFKDVESAKLFAIKKRQKQLQADTVVLESLELMAKLNKGENNNETVS